MSVMTYIGWCLEDISFILFFCIMLFDISRPTMWDVYMLGFALEDISFILFFCIMLFDISRPTMWDVYMLGLTIESSLREDESMIEVILVWKRSGSTERLFLS